MKKFQKQSGQTMVEVLIAMGILAIVVAGVVALSSFAMRVNQLSVAKMQASGYVRDGIEKVRNIRDSSLRTGEVYDKKFTDIGLAVGAPKEVFVEPNVNPITTSPKSRFVNGSYSGNGGGIGGTTPREFKNIGFKPALLIISSDDYPSVWTTTSMQEDHITQKIQGTDNGDNGSGVGGNLSQKGILSLNDKGFTIGSHFYVNKLNITYYYMAFEDSGIGDMQVGSYVGQVGNNTIPLNVTPSFLVVQRKWVNPMSTVRSFWRMKDANSTLRDLSDNTSCAPTTCIQPLSNVKSFTVGSNSGVNLSGQKYYFFAFSNVDKYTAFGTYNSGSGFCNHTFSIDLDGDAPGLVWIGGESQPSVFHQSQIANSDTEANSFRLNGSSSFLENKAITNLLPNAFKVGDRGHVCNSSSSYYYFAIRGVTSFLPTYASYFILNTSSPTETIGDFTRRIQLEKIDLNTIKVKVIVSWDNGNKSTEAIDYLTNWKN